MGELDGFPVTGKVHAHRVLKELVVLEIGKGRISDLTRCLVRRGRQGSSEREQLRELVCRQACWEMKDLALHQSASS
jgi:hypothetical protein